MRLQPTSASHTVLRIERRGWLRLPVPRGPGRGFRHTLRGPVPSTPRAGSNPWSRAFTQLHVQLTRTAAPCFNTAQPVDTRMLSRAVGPATSRPSSRRAHR